MSKEKENWTYASKVDDISPYKYHSLIKKLIASDYSHSIVAGGFEEMS